MLIINRRRFLQVGSLASASMFMPKFLKALEKDQMVPPGNKVLVVIQLSGGNDGLNTVIPYRNDIYYRSRPTIGIQRDKALTLTDETGLHPALTGMKSLYDDGSMGILQNVGYPNPDRSHFRSMDIWQTGSASSEAWSNGWIGRYLDAQCIGCDRPVQALEIDDTLSLALKGELQKGLAFKDPNQLSGGNERLMNELLHQHPEGDKNVDYLYKTMGSTLSSASYLKQQFKTHTTTASYPNTQLGNSLRTISRLISSDISTKVYYVSHGTFDTHVNQLNSQNSLFKQLDDALTSFTKDLKSSNCFQDVVMMTFSEFGRRVEQNASNGTDHGTANNMFIIGGGLKEKGLLNENPDLEHLQDGDLQYRVDFKSVYATMLKNWLGADDKAILKHDYPLLNFV
jgi:uncharacterized protein (DUF1501 family)